MKIYIKDFNDDAFIKKIIPKILYIEINNKVNNRLNINMNNYLIKNYSITLKEIVDLIENNIVVNKVGNMCVISLNENILVQKTGLRLKTMIKLIDYGNTYIKGINLVDKSFRNINKNIKEVYKLYMIKGGRL